MAAPICQRCGAELLLLSEDELELDQSGDTFLPARGWACPAPKCRSEVTLATGERWKPRVHREARPCA